MPKCLFPHCINRNNLICIPKIRKELKNQRGKRGLSQDRNQIINEQNKAWCYIIKTYDSNFVYDPTKKNAICDLHFYPTVLTLNAKGKKIPLLGALPTLNLCLGHTETRNCRCCILNDFESDNLNDQLKRLKSVPLEINDKA